MTTRAFAVAAFVVFGLAVFLDGRLSMAFIDFTPMQHAFPVPSWLDAYARYDSGWYHSIAEKGYFYSGPDRQSSVAFFPAYPAAMRVVAAFVGNYVIAGVLVTIASGLAVTLLFAGWVSATLGTRVSRLAVLLLLSYPFAFYLLGAVYSDALFVAAVLGSFLLLERDRPVLAGLLGILATAARPVGIALVIGLVVRLLEMRGVLTGPRRPVAERLRSLRPADAGVLLSIGGLAAFCALLWIRFDDPLAFARVGGAPGWFKADGIELETVAKLHLFRLLRSFGLNIVTFWLVVQGLYSLLALALVPAVVRRFGWGYGAYLLVVVGIAFVSTRDFIGMGRYVLSAFPAFAAAADLLLRRSPERPNGSEPQAPARRRVWIGPALAVAVQGGLLVWMASLFARWYFLS